MAALPWVVMGIAVAVMLVNLADRFKIKNRTTFVLFFYFLYD